MHDPSAGFNPPVASSCLDFLVPHGHFAAMLPALATAVFGLTFGQPLTLPECRFISMIGDRPAYVDVQPVLCSRRDGPPAPPGLTSARVWFPREKAPAIAASSEATVFLRDGLIAGIDIATAGIDGQQGVLDQLVAKFGKANSVEHPQLQNLSGGSFSAIKATWNQPELWVEYLSAPVRLDLGWVTIETPEVKAARDALYKRRSDQRTPL